MNLPRSSGILLHITSLPGPFGIGDLGDAAYTFADFLYETGQTYWQVLPLNPVGMGASPYSSPSTFAGNPLLISPERLAEDGLLDRDALEGTPSFSADRVEYGEVEPFKEDLLDRAFRQFEQDEMGLGKPYREFKKKNRSWLSDFALFSALSEVHRTRDWTSWPAALTRRDERALQEARQQHGRAIRKHTFRQFIFARQWSSLKAYCNARDIQLFGDLPIYVAHASSDVWAHQELFELDSSGKPTVVAGVPPDYFSETGQRWGNPIYRWDLMKENRYAWWSARLQSALDRVDLLRLDHFRGFEAYWEIPADEETAVNGRWIDGPGGDLFETLRAVMGELPLVAEDLGTITPEVRQLMDDFDIPGMAVLLFGLGDGPTSTYLPHHYHRNLVAYTGTHDTDTVMGWLDNAVSGRSAQEGAEQVTFAREYLGSTRPDSFHTRAIRSVMGSVAKAAIFPMQDLLGLDSRSRMNVPGEAAGNWRWRMRKKQMGGDVAETLSTLTEIYDRST